MPKYPVTWRTFVLRALKTLGGPVHLEALNAEVERLRRSAGLPFSATWRATVRRVLQQTGGSVQDRKHSGIWRLGKPGDPGRPDAAP